MDWKDYDFADLRESLKYEYKLLQYAMGLFENGSDKNIVEFKNGATHYKSYSWISMSGDNYKIHLILKELQPLALCMAYKILDSFIVEILSKEGIDCSKGKNRGYKAKYQLLRNTPINAPVKLQDVVRLTGTIYSYYREDRADIMHQGGLDTTKYIANKLWWFFFYARMLLDFTEVEDSMRDVYMDSLLISAKQLLRHGRLINTNSRLFEIRKAKVINDATDCIVDISCAKNHFQKESDRLKMNIFFDLTIENNGNEYFFPTHKVRTMPDKIDLSTCGDFFVRSSEK